jgi:oxygen-independent coproporphyrinogen-3 oxidase
MDQSIIFDKELLQRYDVAGPRYTSYPTAVQFHDGFGEADYRHIAAQTNQADKPTPLSLYIHVPFCDTVCFYCACNKVVTKDRGKVRPYLDHLYREMELQGELFDRSRKVDQLHWGGGTPTFMSDEEIRELMEMTGRHFTLRQDGQGEYSIEIDPREVNTATIDTLRDVGFNRISMGVQDFEPRVQKAVNRLQSEQQTRDAVDAARHAGFRSISLDLMYGLPLQSVDSFAGTLDKVIDINPDRLSVFNYAHLPERFKPQRRINAEELPSADEKLAILQMTIERLTGAGYIYIGMDHFAKPNDELAIAQRAGTLQRNFQGYSTHADCDLVALGITSIGKVGNCYSQNASTLDDYYARLDAGQLPVMRGIELTRDDLIRRQIIMELICRSALDMAFVECETGIHFNEDFIPEMQALEAMQKDGLLTMDKYTLTVLPAGRLLLRNICMVFDAYLTDQQRALYSRVI